MNVFLSLRVCLFVADVYLHIEQEVTSQYSCHTALLLTKSLLTCGLLFLSLHLLLVLLWSDWSEQCPTHAEVGDEGAEDEQRPPPGVQLDEQLHHRRQHEGADPAA